MTTQRLAEGEDRDCPLTGPSDAVAQTKGVPSRMPWAGGSWLGASREDLRFPAVGRVAMAECRAQGSADTAQMSWLHTPPTVDESIESLN